MTASSSTVTRWLGRWREGDREAEHIVVSRIYGDWHRIATELVQRERNGSHSLQPTALVHEAYLRLVGDNKPSVHDRTHLLGIAARLMRQILVNHALAQKTQKRGRDWNQMPWDHAARLLESRSTDLVALDDALNRLALLDQRHARVVELRFFGGLSIEETAQALNISKRSVVDSWILARAWLRKEIGPA